MAGAADGRAQLINPMPTCATARAIAPERALHLFARRAQHDHH